MWGETYRESDAKLNQKKIMFVFGGKVSIKVFVVFFGRNHVQPKLRCRTKTAKLLDEPEIDELVAQAKWLRRFGTAIGHCFPLKFPKLQRIFGYWMVLVDRRHLAAPEILVGESGPRCTWPHGAVRETCVG